MSHVLGDWKYYTVRPHSVCCWTLSGPMCFDAVYNHGRYFVMSRSNSHLFIDKCTGSHKLNQSILNLKYNDASIWISILCCYGSPKCCKNSEQIPKREHYLVPESALILNMIKDFTSLTGCQPVFPKISSVSDVANIPRSNYITFQFKTVIVTLIF